MSKRISWLWVGLLLCVSACADIWQFQDFQTTEPDVWVPEVVAEAGGDDSAQDAESGAVDVAMESGDAGHTEAAGDAAGDATADAPGDQAADAPCSACPDGAICDNGACVCRDQPNLCP